MTMVDDPNTFWSSACYLKIKGTAESKVLDKAERKGWVVNEEQPIQVYAKVLCQGVAVSLGPVGGSELTK